MRSCQAPSVILRPRHAVRYERFGRQQQAAGHEEVPPDPLRLRPAIRHWDECPTTRQPRRPPGDRRDEFAADPSAVRSDSAGSTLLATTVGVAGGRTLRADVIEALFESARARRPRRSSCTRCAGRRDGDHPGPGSAVGCRRRPRRRHDLAHRGERRPLAEVRQVPTAVLMNGRNTGFTGKSFHPRSSVDAHTSTRPSPVFPSTSAGAPSSNRASDARRWHARACDRHRTAAAEKSPLRGARNSSNTGWLYSSAPSAHGGARRAIDDRAGRGRQRAGERRAATSRAARQPGTARRRAVTNCRRRAAERFVHRNVVQHDDTGAARIGVGERLGRADGQIEARLRRQSRGRASDRIPRAPRRGGSRARRARAPAATRRRTRVVAHEAVGRQPQRAAHVASRYRERRERDARRSAAPPRRRSPSASTCRRSRATRAPATRRSRPGSRRPTLTTIRS